MIIVGISINQIGKDATGKAIIDTQGVLVVNPEATPVELRVANNFRNILSKYMPKICEEMLEDGDQCTIMDKPLSEDPIEKPRF